MSDATPKSSIVDRFVHVVALPFCVRRPGGGGNGIWLSDTVRSVERAGIWRSGPAPTVQPFGSRSEESAWPEELTRYQGKAYFHPFVRRFLYEPKLLRRFHRADVAGLEVRLGHWKLGDFALSLDVLRVELLLLEPDLGLLRVEVASTGAAPLDKLLVLMDAFRRVYPPYADSYGQDPVTWKGGHCPLQVRWFDVHRNEMAAFALSEQVADGSPPKALLQDAALMERGAQPLFDHWRRWLQPFAVKGDDTRALEAHLLGDDRAAIMTWVAMASSPRDLSDGDWLRLCFADDPGKDGSSPYARAFARSMPERFFYDRYFFEGPLVDSGLEPSRILNCGYAFAYVGSAGDHLYFNDQRNGALPTFRHIYCEMGAIALLQKAALLSAATRLSGLVARTPEGARVRLPDQDEVRNFYDHFVEFTQNFWFDEISPQEQGRELFEMWRQHLGIQALYDEVRQELRDLVEYREMRTTGELNKVVAGFGAASIALAASGVAVGVAGSIATLLTIDDDKYGQITSRYLFWPLCRLWDDTCVAGWPTLLFWSCVAGVLLARPAFNAAQSWLRKAMG